jgi:hypothetical protein
MKSIRAAFYARVSSEQQAATHTICTSEGAISSSVTEDSMRVFTTALIAVFASGAALPTDNSLGTWKLNVGKSDYSPGPLPYKSVTMVRMAE